MSEAKSPVASGPPPGRGLYCNRTLNLKSIKVVGFDMDYTLVQYHTKDWEKRAYEHLRARLQQRGWPVGGLEFDAALVMRGLIVDIERGNILKANRFGYVKQAMHGTRMLEFDALRRTYSRTMAELALSRYRFMNTLFSLSEGCMYAQLVDLLDRGELASEHLGYRELYQIVRDNIDATHTEGELKAEVMANPERFVELDPDTVLALLDLHHAGKRLVLITNSEWEYTQAMMQFAFDRFLPAGTTWRELFEVSVCSARKPEYFERAAPLFEVVDQQLGLLRPHLGALKNHGCYLGGHATLLEQQLGVSGDEILYLGDHMFGDVHVSKSVLRWRTCLILRELEDEIAAAERLAPSQAELSRRMAEKEQLEGRYYALRLAVQRHKLGYAPSVDADLESAAKNLGVVRTALDLLDARIGPLAEKTGRALNDRWGLLMRAGNDKSQLARQVERYADVYTSRVSNFLFATPFAYLRSPRGSLPHDPQPVE
ncbi:MAG: HAD family hydrolase [Myxococcales bacterium]|nr:HAD family hydrolase [Myxococcales bacterium]